MCGIAGLVSHSSRDRAAAIELMTDSLRHRGPDMSGHFSSDQHGISLGHRRLAIVDLSATGRQPMTSPSGRYVITFNGEIYNHRTLRAELLARSNRHFEGTSDTEVLLHAIDNWGLTTALSKAAGMFALALLDTRESLLHLARDRIGEKPLYYGQYAGGFAFASEIRALRKIPNSQWDLDSNAVDLFLAYGYVPSPHSVYSAIKKLPAGSIATLKLPGHGSSIRDLRPTIRRYWSLREFATPSRQNAEDRPPFSHFVDGAQEILTQSIRQQMLADVPVGAFLSSGIDSSTVVALMQSVSNRPVRTFTVAFDQAEYDESSRAAAIAAHLGTDHTTIQLTHSELLNAVPSLASIYDEPFADPSQIPTSLVCAAARQHVVVCLTGDGGDELFCGYNRYALGARLESVRRALPPALRRAIGAALRRLPTGMTQLAVRASRRSSRLAGNLNNLPMRARQLRLAAAISSKSSSELYDTLISSHPIRSLLSTGPGTRSALDADIQWERLDTLSAFMLFDQLTYLPDDNLAKVDRASMAVALETRLPLLAHPLVEYSWSIPRDYLLRHGQSKAVLRAILEKFVPTQLTSGPKMGFSVPLSTWLQGPLKEWGDSLIRSQRLNAVIDADPLIADWRLLQSGRSEYAQVVWPALMLSSWLAAE